ENGPGPARSGRSGCGGSSGGSQQASGRSERTSSAASAASANTAPQGGGDSDEAGGGSGGGGAAVERLRRDIEAYEEAASVLPGRVGRKKNLVPTRAGGRTRTPSAKYQEFKEVQQVKTTNKLKGGGGAGGGGGS
ncbi:unnamed protein product, partial [Ectocarpus sp. 12 AP-2014]